MIDFKSQIRMVPLDKAVNLSMQRLRNKRISLHDIWGSPSLNVTPPPDALKQSPSFHTTLNYSSGEKRFHTPSGINAYGLRQYLQLSGQPWKTTRVVTPVPSTPMQCLLSPIRTAAFTY